MSLLTICQDATDLISGLNKPSSIVGSTSPDARTLLAHAKRAGTALMRRHTWESLTTEATFVTTASENQGTWGQLGGPGDGTDYSDFDRMIPETMWDRTLDRKVVGPLTPQERQVFKSNAYSGPYYQFWIQGGSLYIYPAAPEGNTVAFEYITKNWCQSSSGTGQSTWAADNDTGVLDEGLLTLELVWRVKKAKGWDYAQDFDDCEEEIQKAIAMDGARRTLQMGRRKEFRPGIVVPEGSWNL